jgi:hypothetical protein
MAGRWGREGPAGRGSQRKFKIDTNAPNRENNVLNYLRKNMPMLRAKNFRFLKMSKIRNY